MVGHSDNGHRTGIRDLRHQPTFELSAQVLGLDVPTLDTKLQGVTYAIARIPELFQVMAYNSIGEELCVAHYTGDPPLIIWFTYDDMVVQLWYVTKAESSAD